MANGKVTFKVDSDNTQAFLLEWAFNELRIVFGVDSCRHFFPSSIQLSIFASFLLSLSPFALGTHYHASLHLA
jgi:hypothetical protein